MGRVFQVRGVFSGPGYRRILAVIVGTLSATAVVEPRDIDRLLYHAETFDGRELASHGADEIFNPASVVKVATSLWALERLGADHRYQTVFGLDGDWDRRTGILDGELVVQGWGDPDFQVENGFLVARRLNRLGLFRVEGRMRIDGTFWIGWENGVARRVLNPRDRVEVMGKRLRAALDPRRWSASTRKSWGEFCQRHGWDPTDPPRVEITGSIRPGAPADWKPVVVHRSNPLSVLLRRFNVYSNNDIVRVAENLGGPGALEAFVEDRLGLGPTELELQTASGEKRNRITARTTVALLRAFHETLAGMDLTPTDVLPVIGCDPGASDRKFPGLAVPEHAGSVVIKTGTLINTDGGVAALSGFFSTPQGEEVLFCIATTRTGWKEPHWRSLQQEWLLDLISSAGGAVQRPCGPEFPLSDAFAEVEWVVPWDSLG